MTTLPKRLWTGCEPYRFNVGFGDFPQTDPKWTNVFAENDDGSTTVEVNDVNAVFANCTTWMTMVDLGFYPGSVSTGKNFASECENALFWWQGKGKSGNARGKSFWPYRVRGSKRTDASSGASYADVTTPDAAAVAERHGWSPDSVIPGDQAEKLIKQNFFMTDGVCYCGVAPANGWCSPKISIKAYDGDLDADGNPMTHESAHVELWAKVSHLNPGDDPEVPTSTTLEDEDGFNVLLYSNGCEKCFQFPVSKGDQVTVFSKYTGEEENGFEEIDISIDFRASAI